MKHRLLFFLIVVFVSNCLKAQTELEIKTTGKFIYSWAFESSEAAARESAKLGLMDTIFVSLLKESAIDQTDTIFINVIDYFVKQIGFKWQAIAFADKTNVKVKLEQRKQLKVIPIIIRDPSDSTTKKKSYYSTNSKVYTTAQVLNTDISSTKSKDFKTGNPVLDELLILHDAASLEKQLVKFKSDLKLNFGDKSNYPDDSGCYIFVIDEKSLKIIAVYDKGKEYRKDFLTNSSEGNYADKYKGSNFVYVVIK